MNIKETQTSPKEELLNINRTLFSLLETVQNRSDIADSRLDSWGKACKDIHRQISDESVRVAIIGAVKSGKSTFVNSIFRGDYLKRGAGIVTSIVTRVRRGENLKAFLHFKSWNEINTEIENALVLFPAWEKQSDEKLFDIQNEKDRQSLKLALMGLRDDMIIIDGARDPNSILLSLYLKGYDRVAEMISGDLMTAEFSGDEFARHRSFVSNDSLAVYLKDVELEINHDDITSSIEIADCQGSDSPNPLHLVMIQNYLIQTHFIIYVISSRTGLREADIKFLSMIKKMGIMENTMFVVNVDISEHDSLEDLRAIIGKVKEELEMLRPDPDIYALSALFNLFSAQNVSLSNKNSLRLAQWMEEKEMISFVTRETKQFNSTLHSKLSQERIGLLLRNHLERMAVIASGIESLAWINKDLMEKDTDSATDIIKKIRHYQDQLENIRTLIKSTLKGSSEEIMKDLKAEIDSFFNVHSGGISSETLDFIRSYSVSFEKYREKLAVSGFSNTLHFIFQKFKRELDVFMAENINPEIARFLREIDERLQRYLESIARPYKAMASDAVSELRAAIRTPGPDIQTSSFDGQSLLDIDEVKQTANLKLPSGSAALQYSAKIRAEAIVRLGFYSAINLFKKALKKSAKKRKEEQIHALADGFELIKAETEKTIVFHFENYRENIKFQYVLKLLDASTENLHDFLIEQFQSHGTDLKTLGEMMKTQGNSRKEMIKFLDDTAIKSKSIQKSLKKARAIIGQGNSGTLRNQLNNYTN
jgi:GTPase SAR1 family protein